MIRSMTSLDWLSFLVCSAICLQCVAMLRERTTFTCAPAHIGLLLIGFAAFLSCLSLLRDLHQAHVPGLALNVGLAATLGYLMLPKHMRDAWDGRTERRERRQLPPVFDCDLDAVYRKHGGQQ